LRLKTPLSQKQYTKTLFIQQVNNESFLGYINKKIKINRTEFYLEQICGLKIESEEAITKN